MQEYYFLIAIASVLFIGAMSPGPSFFVVARNALSYSRVHGICTAIGTALGVAFFAVVAGLGVSVLLQQSPVVFWCFKVFGAIYLMYIAYIIWRGAHSSLSDTALKEPSALTLLKAFSQGVLVQISNPKTALVIAGIYAAFVPENPPENTSWILPSIAFVIDFSWYAFVAIVLSCTHSRSVYAQIKSHLDIIAAVFLFLVAIKLWVPLLIAKKVLKCEHSYPINF